MRDSTPEEYAAWLSLEINRVRSRTPDKRIVFINAWNEWAEGNHLEPDLKFGRAFLEATRQALSGPDKFKVNDQKTGSSSLATPEQAVGEINSQNDSVTRGAAVLKVNVNIKSNSVDGLYEKAQVMIESGRYEDAKRTLRSILDADPRHAKSLNDLAVLCSITGETEKAIGLLLNLLEMEPNNVISLKNLGKLYLQSGKIEDALKSYSAVLKITPEDINALLSVAKVCFQLQKPEYAKFFYNKVLMLSKDPKLQKQVLLQLKEIEGKGLNEGSQAMNAMVSAAAAVNSVNVSLNASASVSIVIPVFNNVECTKGCIESILSQVSHQKYEIIVVDNGSTDGTQDYLRNLSLKNKQIKYVRNDSNRGFVEACNNGAKSAEGKYLIFLNSDTEPLSEWFDELLKTAQEEENVGIVGSKLIYPDDTIQHAGIVFGNDKLPYNIYRGNPSNFVFADRQRHYQAVTAASMLIERNLFFEAGCFDETYINGYEGVDLCLKVGSRGKRIVYNPKSVLIHYEGKSESKQNNMDFHKKHFLESWAHKIDQDDYLFFLKDGEELMKQGLIEEGKQNIDHAQSLRTVQVEIEEKKQLIRDLYATAQQLISERKYEEAKENLRKALEIEPRDPACLNDLAVLYSSGKEVEAAIGLLIQLVEIEPENTVARRNLAKLYSQTGKIEDALKSYLAVLKITPEDTNTLLALAKVCLHLQKLEDAKFFYNKVLMISKDPELRKQILQQLKEIEQKEIQETLNGNAANSDGVSKNSSDVSINTFALHGGAATASVSIIIPVFNNVEFTMRCIESIHLRVRDQKYEIIVVDNGSTDGTHDYLRDLSSKNSRVKYLQNETNVGFVEACNIGAKSAQGKYILLLNNDTQVNENWLEALIDFAERTPNCGAVGSKLIYPDGRLQEAGGITFSDGNGWNYGRGSDPNHPKFNFVREVDYISGASLMVRRDLWEEIGGLDMRYAPAYCEDSDLCFAIRHLGYKVFYQPRSSVVHFEGATSGTNLNEGFKKFQIINRPKFVEKWKAELIHQYPNDPRNVEKAASRGIVKRILVADPTLPMFDRAAGSLHLFNILKILKEMNFHITFISGNRNLQNYYQPILQEMGIETYAGDPDAMYHYGYIARYQKIDYAMLFQEREFDIALIDFWHHAEYYLPLIKKYSPLTTVIIDTEDVHFVREKREAEVKGDPEDGSACDCE